MAKSEVPESVMDTLRRLSAMQVDRGCTPAEAARAAAHMARLLEKWQLSHFDIETNTYDEGVTEESADFDNKQVSNAGVSEWVFLLAGTLSYVHDCRYFFRAAKTNIKITFVGHSSDAQVCQYLFLTLSRLLKEMGIRDGKVLKHSGSRLRKFLRQYLQSAVREVGLRLRAERDKAKQAEVQSRALVVVKANAVNEYWERQHPDMVTDKKNRTPKDFDPVAHVLGENAGRKVEIRRGVEGGDNQKQLPG